MTFVVCALLTIGCVVGFLYSVTVSHYGFAALSIVGLILTWAGTALYVRYEWDPGRPNVVKRFPTRGGPDGPR